MQEPTGLINQPFIVQQAPNGDCWPYAPSQADILASDWNTVGEAERSASQAQAEHASTR
jgi:hypothetical protein